jgi:hypothetical protein
MKKFVKENLNEKQGPGPLYSPEYRKKQPLTRNPKKEPKYRHIAFDWNADGEEIGAQIKAAVEDFGLFVTENPAAEGSDMYAYIISDRPLTPEELEEVSEDQ